VNGSVCCINFDKAGVLILTCHENLYAMIFLLLTLHVLLLYILWYLECIGHSSCSKYHNFTFKIKKVEAIY